MSDNSKNYFRVLLLEEKFTSDNSELEKSYLILQQELRKSSSSLREDNEIHDKVQLINQAYHFLKNPINRAQHLLELKNPAGFSNNVKPELLAKIIEFEEEVEELKTAEILEKIEAMYKENLKSMESAFNVGDYKLANSHCVALKYLIKLRERIYATHND